MSWPPAALWIAAGVLWGTFVAGFVWGMIRWHQWMDHKMRQLQDHPYRFDEDGS